ncbi:hypothetical protein A0H76_2897 [Hepatospora eriocheir]|uniref:Uncharacterized protein n=1 Tax=Hepatospora eriocheir TaxID=1081669 RepID=A0A1X0Q5K2_9MICR|nr:hypothetical protein A0H76_2897 [Hepatospora eriocheir]
MSSNLNSHLKTIKSKESNPDLLKLIQERQKKQNKSKKPFKLLAALLLYPMLAKTFLQNLKKPKIGEFLQVLRLFSIVAILLGLLCYVIKVFYIPINNILIK